MYAVDERIAVIRSQAKTCLAVAQVSHRRIKIWAQPPECATCSPCLKLKPVSKSTKSGYLTVNVETYGGGLWHTWFDRDLSVAGRVLVKEGDRLQHRLVRTHLHLCNGKYTTHPLAQASAALLKTLAMTYRSWTTGFWYRQGTNSHSAAETACTIDASRGSM